MAEPQRKRWTVAEVEALPYDEWRRYEVIDGELFVSTAPHFEHQAACTKGSRALDEWNDETGLGRVFVAPGVIFSESDGVMPDVVWVSRERLAQIADSAGHLRGAPELVAEVLSPGRANERRDRETKLRLYSRYGVEEYWLLDWRTRTVVVYRRAGETLARVARLSVGDTLTTPLLPGFSLPLSRLFV
jgi:Uma2 family endonuclease